jgi:Zn-dependent protease
MKKLFILLFMLLSSNCAAQVGSLDNSHETSLDKAWDHTFKRWFLGFVNPFTAVVKNPSSIAVQAIGAYGATALATAGHELGHIAAAKAFKFPVRALVLGRNLCSDDYKQVNSKNKMHYGFGWNPFCGVSCVEASATSSAAMRYKKAAHVAAGPLAGIATSYVLDKAITVGTEYKKGESLSNAVRIGMQKPVFSSDDSTWILKTALLWNTCIEAFGNLLPLHKSCDGYNICNMLRVKPTFRSILQRIGQSGIGLSLTMSLVYIGNNMDGAWSIDKESGNLFKK